jgi:hypothetical protein
MVGYKTCPANVWTSLWVGPTWGFTIVYAETAVTIKWRRYASTMPFYNSGEKLIPANTATIIPHGGPASVLSFDVKPQVTTRMLAR